MPIGKLSRFLFYLLVTQKGSRVIQTGPTVTFIYRKFEACQVLKYPLKIVCIAEVSKTQIFNKKDRQLQFESIPYKFIIHVPGM